MNGRDFTICVDCGGRGRLARGVEIYPHRPELMYRAFWVCDNCDAYVGCHPGTTTPMGRMAGPELRAMRQNAHRAFDPLWRSGRFTRSGAYVWLAGRLGIPAQNCHIGYFDAETCRRVAAICARELLS